MKFLIGIYIVLSLFVILIGCEQKEQPRQKLNSAGSQQIIENTDKKNNETEQIGQTSQKNLPEETKKIETASSREWFPSGSFSQNNELIGKTYIVKREENIDKNKLIKMLNNPISWSGWELLLNNDLLLKYQFEDIDYFKNSSILDIDYFDLSKDFSNDIFYTKLSNGGFSLLIDYKENSMTILENQLNKKRVISSYLFIEKYKLTDLKYVGSFKDHNVVEIVFVNKQDNTIYSVSSDMKLMSKKQLGNWNFISSYFEPSNSDSDDLYIYLTNEQKSKIKKVNLLKDVVLHERNVPNQILGIINKIDAGDSGVLYLLTKFSGNYIIYCVREKDFGFVARKDVDSNGMKSVNVDDIRFYTQNEKAMFIILLDKSKEIPIDKINAFDDSWVELK